MFIKNMLHHDEQLTAKKILTKHALSVVHPRGDE